MSAKKDVKKRLPPNPHARRNRVVARLNNQEMQVAIEKALVYAGGEMSELIRDAIAAYKGRRK